MKKLFTVLAVLLVASVAFAGFSGSVKAQYTFNFDERTIGYTEPGFSAVDVSFKWDSQTYTVGEADGTHIDFALSAGLDGFYNLSDDHATGYDPFLPSYIWAYKVFLATGEEIKAAVTLSVDTFKIVGKNWEVSFIDDLALDFAKSAINTKKFNGDKLEENKAAYTVNNSLKGKHNLVATVAGYKFGFGLGSDDWTDDVTFALTAVTPEYDFNGVKAQFGAGYEVVEEDYKLAASAKAAYATDKFAVSGAYDALYADEFVSNDLAVKFDFAPVAVDVYFANENSVAKDKYHDYFPVTDPDKHIDTLPSNYLSAKVVVDVAKVAENVPVKVTLTGNNLLNEDSQILSVSAETTIVPNFKFGVYFNDWLDFETSTKGPNDNHQKLGATVEFTGVEKMTLKAAAAYRFAKGNDAMKTLYVSAGAAYAHDLFTATGDVYLQKYYEKKDATLGAVLGATSTTLVKGAELSAKAYFNLNNMDDIDSSSNATNKLALACKVSF